MHHYFPLNPIFFSFKIMIKLDSCICLQLNSLDMIGKVTKPFQLGRSKEDDDADTDNHEDDDSPVLIGLTIEFFLQKYYFFFFL